jgi:hypothetical protein
MVYNYDVLNFGGAPEPQAQWRLPAMTSDRQAIEALVSDLLGTSHDKLVLLKENRVIAFGWCDGITLQIQLIPSMD